MISVAAAAAAVAVAVSAVHVADVVCWLRECQQFRSKSFPPTGQPAEDFTSKLPCNACDVEIGRRRRRKAKSERETGEKGEKRENESGGEEKDKEGAPLCFPTRQTRPAAHPTSAQLVV